jgi:hypothetical protein
MNPRDIHLAAECARQVYDKRSEKSQPERGNAGDLAHESRIDVDLYRILSNPLAAQFWACDNSETLVVALQGTLMDKLGNWILTNLQSYLTPPVVRESKELGKQDSVRQIADGNVHQGFLRAYCALWYGQEPALDKPRTPDVGLVRTVRYGALLGLPIALLLIHRFFHVGGERWLAGVADWLIVAVGFLLLETGALDDLLKRPLDKVARDARIKAANEFREEVSKRARAATTVIFTGHSLGGAMAALAFLDYMAATGPQQHRNAFLVTFGAPRLGDEKFMQAFDAHRHRCEFIADEHDPVPHVPNPSLGAASTMARVVCGLFSWSRPENAKQQAVGERPAPLRRALCLATTVAKVAAWSVGIATLLVIFGALVGNEGLYFVDPICQEATCMWVKALNVWARGALWAALGIVTLFLLLLFAPILARRSYGNAMPVSWQTDSASWSLRFPAHSMDRYLDTAEEKTSLARLKQGALPRRFT